MNPDLGNAPARTPIEPWITAFHDLGAPNPFRPKTDYQQDRNRTRGTVTARKVSMRAFEDTRDASANLVVR